MTTTSHPTARAALDQNGIPMTTQTLIVRSTHHAAPKVGFGRLLAAEARKLVNTRSGFWVIIAMSVITLGFTLLNAFLMASLVKDNVEGMKLSWQDTVISASSLLSMMVAVLAILTITNEWGQRTVLTTFTQEPRRSRVLVAKIVIALLVTLVAVAISFPIGAGFTALAGAANDVAIDWTLNSGVLLGFTVSALLGALMGIGFGLVTLNAPAAIVAYFVLPTVIQLTSMIQLAWKPYADIDPWVNPVTAQTPLLTGDVTGEQWARVAVSSLIWIGIPVAIGAWRWMRREAK